MGVTRWLLVLMIAPFCASAQSLEQGIALFNGGKFAEAKAVFETLLKQNDKLAEAHYRLGLILAAQRQPAGAVTRLREALRLQPDWPEALAGLAFTLATAPTEKDRNPSEALRVATHAVDLTGHTNALAMDSMAAACAASGRYEEAVRNATKAVELARAAGDQTRADQMQSRLKLYEAGKPYRQ